MFHNFSDRSNAIRCYRCTVAPTNRHENRSQQLCLNFSESDEFVVDCPYSTMCMKKIYKYQLLSGEVIETVTRNCANQEYTEKVFIIIRVVCCLKKWKRKEIKKINWNFFIFCLVKRFSIQHGEMFAWKLYDSWNLSK